MKNNRIIFFNLIILFFVFSFTLVLGQDNSSNNNLRELVIDSNIVQQKYCSDGGLYLTKNNKGYWSGGILIKIRLSIKNNSLTPIILYKNYFAVFSTQIYSDTQKKNIIFDAVGITAPKFNFIEEDYPSDKNFVILKPNEIFEIETKDFIMGLDKKKVFEGRDYWIQHSIEVWGGANGYRANLLKEKWKNIGNLFLDAITTKITKISLEKNPKKELCFNE